VSIDTVSGALWGLVSIGLGDATLLADSVFEH
jgi:hypothetical protein